MISDPGVFQNCWQENYPGESGREESFEIIVTGKILERLGKQPSRETKMLLGRIRNAHILPEFCL